MEIGSSIELQFSKGKEFHHQLTDIVRLNIGRAAIWHAFHATGREAIWIPYYQCEIVREMLLKYGVGAEYYHINNNLNPTDLDLEDNEAVLFVNYYGVMSHSRMADLASKSKNSIIDNCQALFSAPIADAMNVCSCRKFVDVPDGIYVIGKDAHIFVGKYPQRYSSDTAAFLLVRIEYGCEGKGYEARSMSEYRIDAEPIMKMSKLTRIILNGIDYEFIRRRRRENFRFVHDLFGNINKINPLKYYDEDATPMVYPLVTEDEQLIQRLFQVKHFQGHWWSYICGEQPEDSFEYRISKYVTPITIDQRYGKEELKCLSKVIHSE